LEHFVSHAERVAPSVLFYVLIEHKPWIFAGPPVEKPKFEDEIRTRDSELYDDCKQILGMPPSWTPHTHSVWDGAAWYETSTLDSLFSSHDRSFGVVLDHHALGEALSKKLTRPIYEVRPTGKKGG
jgi:hypothetical protein